MFWDDLPFPWPHQKPLVPTHRGVLEQRNILLQIVTSRSRTAVLIDRCSCKASGGAVSSEAEAVPELNQSGVHLKAASLSLVMAALRVMDEQREPVWVSTGRGEIIDADTASLWKRKTPPTLGCHLV